VLDRGGTTTATVDRFMDLKREKRKISGQRFARYKMPLLGSRTHDALSMTRTSLVGEAVRLH
jgi:hypothetical protein